MIFYPSNEKNKHGFYRVGTQFCTYNLFEALEQRQKTNEDIRWDFNDEFFSTIDWTQEPAESLKDLYAQRAAQLREKYDYLVLFFSGGSDSHNILSTFVDYGIYLDEVLTYHTYEISQVPKDSSLDSVGEVFLAAIPEAKRLLQKSPRTIHRVIDVSDFIKDSMIEIETRGIPHDFLYRYNNHCSPRRFGIRKLRNLPEYQKLYDTGKKVCFIHGTDKPGISFQDHKWFFRFNSMVDGGGYHVDFQFDNQYNGYDEFFYWAPDAWKIPVKQCHKIRNFFRRNPNIIKMIVNGAYPDAATTFSRLAFLNNTVPVSLIKKIIYPYWRSDIVDHGKFNNTLLGALNQWYSKSTSLSMIPGALKHRSAVTTLLKTMGYDDFNQYKNYIVASRPYYF
jgi:hypothetical protein